MPSMTRGCCGATLAELLVALSLGAIIAGAVVLVLVRHEQMASALAVRATSGAQLRHGGDALRSELRALREGGAPLLRAADTAIEMRATVGVALVCDGGAIGTRQVVVAAAAGTAGLPADLWQRAIAPGDSVLLRDPVSGDWQGATLESVGSTTCLAPAVGGAIAARRLTLETAAPVTGPGWIVRVVRPVVWSAYRGADRAWWLGVRERTGGRWGTVQPVMGPLAAGSGTPSVFGALDRDGAPIALSAPAAWGLRIALQVASRIGDSLAVVAPLQLAP